MVERRKVEWGKRWRIFVPSTTDSSERAEQWSNPNATALSIYRGVTYTNTTDEEGKSNAAPLLNRKNRNRRRRSSGRGDVIVRWLALHVFTIKALSQIHYLIAQRKCVQMFYFRC